MLEYEIINTLNGYAWKKNDHQIANCLVTGFTGQLKGWWDNCLNEIERNWILIAQKRENNNQSIVDQKNNIIQDVVL